MQSDPGISIVELDVAYPTGDGELSFGSPLSAGTTAELCNADDDVLQLSSEKGDGDAASAARRRRIRGDAVVLALTALCAGLVPLNVGMQRVLAIDKGLAGGLWFYDVVGSFVLLLTLAGVLLLCCTAKPLKRHLAAVLYVSLVAWVLTCVQPYIHPNTEWDRYLVLVGDRALDASRVASLYCEAPNRTRDSATAASSGTDVGAASSPAYVELRSPQWRVAPEFGMLRAVVSRETTDHRYLLTAPIVCSADEERSGMHAACWVDTAALRTAAERNPRSPVLAKHCGWDRAAPVTVRGAEASPDFALPLSGGGEVAPAVNMTTLFEWNGQSREDAVAETEAVDRKHAFHIKLFLLIYLGLTMPVVLASIVFGTTAERALSRLRRKVKAGSPGGTYSDDFEQEWTDIDTDAEEI